MTPRIGPLAGRRVLAVFAHPDDESIACGATLARCADAGARVSLLCVTRGEAGQRVPGSGAEDVALGVVRRGELQQAAGRLGIDDVIVLDHPDGSLTGVDPALFRHEIVLTIRHLQPDVVITFGPDGLYWHPDHIFVHERVTEAVQSFGAAGPALFYVVLPNGLMKTVLDTAIANPGAPPDLSLWTIDPDAFGAYAPDPTLVIEVRSHVDRKLAALRCHRTQIGDVSPFVWLTPAQAQELLGREYFVRAPVGSGSRTCLDDLASAWPDSASRIAS
jgi:N-acetyl-1-D-myo-inositol-2-amino-2-deoxy-alpha-D-glucopyranoside deacetylase